MADKIHLHIEIEGATAMRFRRDACEMGVSLGSYAEKAFESFLKFSKDQRRVKLADVRKKIFGRKLKEAAA